MEKTMDGYKLLGACRALVVEVGAFINEARLTKKDVEYKEDRSLVSYVDKEAEKKLLYRLQELMPEAKVLAEESYEKKEGKEAKDAWLWVVDPLDGTTNYIHQIPAYCISIALLHEGEPVLGIIYDIAQQDCFWALAGKGAYLNDTRLQVSQSKVLKEALIALGFFYANRNDANAYMNLFATLGLQTRGWRRLGSAALQLAYVAAGRFDAYVDIDLKPWDVAAGLLLVKEAGGEVLLNEHGDASSPACHIMAAGGIYETMLEKIKKLFPSFFTQGPV